jgi:hypothetical protein
MKLILDGQPPLVHFAVWAGLAVFLVSFAGVLCGIVLTLAKTEALVTTSDEVKLSYWERAARKNTRVSSIFIDPNLKNLRYLLFASIVGCFSSFSILLAIIGIFGERS